MSHRGTNRSAVVFAALLCTTLVVLAGCGIGGLPGGDNPGKSAEPKPTPTWSDWTTLEYSASVVAARADRVVVFNHDKQKLEMFDRAGKKLRNVPGGVGKDQAAHVVAGPKALYVREKDASIIALDWKTGKQLWKFDPTTISECLVPDRLDLTSGAGGYYLRKGDPLVLTFGQSAADNEGGDQDPPEHCTTPSASAEQIPTAIGIDPQTGKTAWKSNTTSLNNEVGPTTHDPSGTYIFQVESHRGYPGVRRIEVATGKTMTTGLELTDKGYMVGADIWLSPYAPDAFTLEWDDGEGSEPSTALDAHVTKWVTPKQNAAGKAGTTSLRDLPSSEVCKSSIQRAESSGTPYCLDEGDGSDYHVAAVTKTGPGKSWTAKPDSAVGEGPSEGSAHSRDPLITRKGKNPLITLPTAGGSLTAFDLETGDSEWKWPESGSDNQSSDSQSGDNQSSSSQSGDTQSVLWAAYVPAMGQSVAAHGNTVVGLDGATGKEAWTKKLDGGTVGMLTVTGGAVAAKVDLKSGGAQTHLRFATDGKDAAASQAAE